MLRRTVLGMALTLALASGEPAWAGDKPPVLVELYTSQGSSSCPAADVYLADLVKRKDVIALSFHVNYWDYLGWKDTFASERNAWRQRAYAKALGERSVYTPQIVVNGTAHEVGSRRDAVDALIAKVSMVSRNKPKPSLTLAPAAGETLAVTLTDVSEATHGTVWLERFDRVREISIDRGENAGRTLLYHNVVADFRRIGEWTGGRLELTLGLSDLREGGRDGVAVFVQESSLGRVLAVATHDIRPR